MKKYKLGDMTGGWFIGDFKPSLYKTEAVEAAVKYYKAGDYEKKHYHKIATEYTVVVSGRILMNGTEYRQGDIIEISPLEVTDFKALEDSVNTVIKIPGAVNDKYSWEEE